MALTSEMKISARDATINSLKEEIAGLNKYRKKVVADNAALKAELSELRQKLDVLGDCEHVLAETRAQLAEMRTVAEDISLKKSKAIKDLQDQLAELQLKNSELSLILFVHVSSLSVFT